MTIFRTVNSLEEWTPPEAESLPLERRPVLTLRPLTARQRLEVLKMNEASRETGSQGPMLEACFQAFRAGVADVRNLAREGGDPFVPEWENAEVLGSVCRCMTQRSVDVFEITFLISAGQHIYRRALLTEEDRGKSSSPRP